MLAERAEPVLAGGPEQRLGRRPLGDQVPELLIYLRGVAPKEVKSSDIYWGAMPWIGLQALMVALVIAFPVTVTGLLDKPVDVDLNKIKIEVPQIELPPLDLGPPSKQ